ncbi:MAG TPA: protein kinase, partial [Myxococcaceae bacterium]|nr:protein kinase [Myxococcaceae bacterium]
MPPKVIGPYRVLDTIGSGGVGTVYRAVDRRNNETVALKLLSTGPALDPRAARRLAREFETLYELSHPNVVKVFDTGVYQGYPYLAMELVEGLTLRHYLALSAEALETPLVQKRETSSESAPELWELSDDGEGSGYAPSPFTLSSYSEELPSEEVDYASGPESVRALADAADEPDTINSLENELPYEMAGRDKSPV